MGISDSRESLYRLFYFDSGLWTWSFQFNLERNSCTKGLHRIFYFNSKLDMERIWNQEELVNSWAEIEKNKITVLVFSLMRFKVARATWKFCFTFGIVGINLSMSSSYYKCPCLQDSIVLTSLKLNILDSETKQDQLRTNTWKQILSKWRIIWGLSI